MGPAFSRWIRPSPNSICLRRNFQRRERSVLQNRAAVPGQQPRYRPAILFEAAMVFTLATTSQPYFADKHIHIIDIQKLHPGMKIAP